MDRHRKTPHEEYQRFTAIEAAIVKVLDAYGVKYGEMKVLLDYFMQLNEAKKTGIYKEWTFDIVKWKER